MAVKKVLVVDDSATDRKNLELICSDAGYTVISARCGTEALERVKRDLPDVVLLDIVMADLNGYQVCRAITSNLDTRHIAVVLVSSNSELTHRVWGEKQGARSYVAKPFTSEQILSQLRSL